MSNIILTKCQESAIKEFTKFAINPSQIFFNLSGNSGTGKSTTVPYLIKAMLTANKTNKVLGSEGKPITRIAYCASTHKAARVLSDEVGGTVTTIHSMFSLTRGFDRDTGDEYYFKNPKKNVQFLPDTLLVIDEVSLIDETLFKLITKHLPNNCKVVLIGDSNQLPPINHVNSPVYSKSFPITYLTTPTRFDNEELIEFSNELRLAVEGNKLPKLNEGNHIKILDREQFNNAMVLTNKQGFNVKTIAWRNKTVGKYSDLIHKELYGDAKYNVGQKLLAKSSFKTAAGDLINSQTELLIEQPPKEIIKNIYDETLEFMELVTDKGTIHIPNNKAKAMKAIKYLKDNKEWAAWYGKKDFFAEVINSYSITVHMSQGSTYDYIFIDLQDIMANKRFNEMLRLLYVAGTRGRKEVLIYTGR